MTSPTCAISEERLAEDLRSLATSLKRPGGKESRITKACTRAAAALDDLRARLAAAEGRAEVRCSGCGSDWTSEDLARERKRAGILSCCPERNAMTIDEWKERATTATARVAELEGALTDRARVVRLYCTHDKMTDAEKVGVLLHHPHFAVASVLSTQNIRQNVSEDGQLVSGSDERVENARAVWPFACPKARSCSRHHACMYGCKAHAGRPSEELKAEIARALLDMIDSKAVTSHPASRNQGMNVHEYVEGYEFRGESDYTPNDREKTLIEDAIAGYLTPPVVPVAEVWRVLAERFGVERDHMAGPEADAAMAALLSATSPAAEIAGTVGGWQPIASVAKQGRILAMYWILDLPGYPGKWTDPTVYEWDEAKQYFGNRQRGVCIWPQYEKDYVCIVLPAEPPPRARAMT